MAADHPFYDKYVSSHYASIREIRIEAVEQHRKIFRRYFGALLPNNRAGNILDIGCGYGAFVYFLNQEGYQNVWGVDISQEQVDAAKRLGLSNVHCGDLVEFLEKQSIEFDCITAIDVLEHVPKGKLLPLLQTASAALKPGGVFLMQVPNAASPLFGVIRYGDYTHEIAFTRDSASQVLRMAGFSHIRVFPTGPIVHGPVSFIRWVLWHGFGLLVRLYLAAETGVWRGHIVSQNLIAVAVKP